jgi:hypothetical protein
VWIGCFFVLAYVNVGKQLWMLTIVKYPGDCRDFGHQDCE